jgi:putative transposase
MAWRVESMVDQRLCFIAACLRADEPMSGLCLRFEISRKTGYKWLSRYRDFGLRGWSISVRCAIRWRRRLTRRSPMP